jgi:outer membrane lipoprotein-sorting protein/peroxiredoxin
MSTRSVPAFFFSAVCVLTAQDPDANAVLGKVAQTYKSLKTQHTEAIVVTDMKAQGMRIEMPVTVAVVKPDKLRVEIKNPMMGSQTISDGQSTWMYVAMLKQYTKKAASPGVSSMSSGPGDLLQGEKVLDRLQSAQVVRQEKLSLEGQEIDCYVIEAEYTPKAGDQVGQEGPKIFWIDKTRSVILKAASTMKMKSSPMGGPMEMTQTVTVTSIKLDERLPDSLFVFVPPDGAKEVDELTPPGVKRTSLKDKEASDFTLKGLDNKEYTLSSYQGKVVLLDFWTTWCAPCRADMPALQKLHEESARQGFAVITINVGEDAEIVREFTENHKYTFPVLMARFDDQVISDYQARAFPTMVVIGKAGKIVAYKIGSGGDTAIRAMIAEAADPADTGRRE